ncbi:glycosyltransferase [Bradyrhizobium sp. WSM 1704]|uniref:glycosyltransferase n=1 Tax=Bradyrhizobium semiaridum TaxID=2821404 RepID=UPI001CE27A67|nr:glycosyltransferase [Bradyrhizobium semiaridum]MCA6122028.1 glycosyltransferase [Bradyrhizobium semiaridum]
MNSVLTHAADGGQRHRTPHPAAMRILVAHNYYQQAGGEDEQVAVEVAMLRSFGHEVAQFSLHNNAIDAMNRLALASRTIWNRSSSLELTRLLRTHRPQIVHFHNTFPLISPAAYWAARAEGAAVVQTLHNFRLCCINAVLFRDGRVCEDCLGKAVPWPGILHKCYRNSLGASSATATMVATHRLLGTWQKAVDVYIALSEFSRGKLLQGGLPADKITVKPNFVYPDPGPGNGNGRFALFVGRLSQEKGIETLLAAWRRLRDDIQLKIVGDGPLAQQVREAAAADGRIEWLGYKPLDFVHRLLGEAAVLLLTSRCYENFPRVAVEAFAKGTPVIASRLGAMAEIVEDGRTGLHFEPGDADDLAAKVGGLLAHPSELAQMRGAARERFAQNFIAETNHDMLMAIYQRAVGIRHAA